MNDNTCGHCLRFRKTDGYCQKTSRYVNALAIAKCFLDPEEAPAVTPGREKGNRRRGGTTAAARTEKRCSRCGRVLPLDKFTRCRRNADGRGCYCRECGAEITKQYRYGKKEETSDD